MAGFFQTGCVNHSVFRILFACLFVFAVIFSGINLKSKAASGIPTDQPQTGSGDSLIK
jgi:hypothetical protein